MGKEDNHSAIGYESASGDAHALPKKKLTLSSAKKRKASRKKKQIVSGSSSIEEREFALMREQHDREKNNNSNAYVKRRPQPKLIQKGEFLKKVKEKESEKQRHPPVPKFGGSRASNASNKDLKDLPLLPVMCQSKKPRPPQLPNHMRKSEQSPTPAE